MNNWINGVQVALAARLRNWRRARNLRLGRPASGTAFARPAVLASLGVLGGALVLAGHARYLGGAAGGGASPAAPLVTLEQLQSAAAGMTFQVASTPGIMTISGAHATLVIAARMRPAPPVRVNLCQQMQHGRLVPVRIGYQFAEIASLTRKNIAVRNAVLTLDPRMPNMDIGESADALVVSLPGGGQWVSDTGDARLRHEGWLSWPEGAVRVQRRALRQCPKWGEVLLQVFRRDDSDPSRPALVTALPHAGKPVAAYLPEGRYVIPAVRGRSMEDQALFRGLADAGLLRLSDRGLAEIAPRDLALWQQAPAEARLAAAAGWPDVDGDAARAQLFRRLYRMADGAYVREQVRIFNQERQLLAWRVRPQLAYAPWQASVAGAPVATGNELPLAAARLFAQVPQGWGPWQRVAAWPLSGETGSARITVQLAQPAVARLELLVVGRVQGVTGGRLLGAPRAACTGRACRTADAVQLVSVAPHAGARELTLSAAPLAMASLDDADRQYRHLYVAQGKLAWRTLNAAAAGARAVPPAGVRLSDRHGALLWSGGEASPAAVTAGLAPLLGVHPSHGGSVAGMLSRVPAPDGQANEGRLSLDLALQTAAHHALDCMGLRRGRLQGTSCLDAQPIPEGRHAGMVVIDTGSGDILAAAGSGGMRVTPENWTEVRDFDRANPDRSPLRLPALQHDGGAHRSPGSTFKIVTALGLELAARNDPQLAALLEPMPLAAINTMAQRRGFAFQTAAASYPHATRGAHITNYRDQHLDRRADKGRLGLSQALAYSLNTWFAWSGELSDASLFGKADGGAPGLQALEPGALDSVRPIVAMAHKVGFGQQLRLDGGLLPSDFRWQQWDALRPSEAGIDSIDSRHELRQMAIGLRMQATPLHMAMVAGAVGEGRALAPRLLLELNGRKAQTGSGAPLGVRLDRVRAGLKGVVDHGTAAAAFGALRLRGIRHGLSGKTGTAPSLVTGADGRERELATVWFTGYLEPGTIKGEQRRLALAVFISHSDGTGGEHAAPVAAAWLEALAKLQQAARKEG